MRFDFMYIEGQFLPETVQKVGLKGDKTIVSNIPELLKLNCLVRPLLQMEKNIRGNEMIVGI